jgi:hypothetical protein
MKKCILIINENGVNKIIKHNGSYEIKEELKIKKTIRKKTNNNKYPR